MARSSHAKFANHISFRGGICFGPVWENSVWTKMLRKLISEEECELGMYLTKTPIAAEDLAKKVGIPEEEVARMLWNMADHGTIFPHFVNGKPYYRLVPFIPGVYEYQMDYRTMDKEMAELFVKAPAEVAWLTRNLSRVDGGIMKVVPVMQEVAAQPQVLSFEDVMTYIDGTDMYSVADCACRYAMKLLGTGCEHPIEDICLQLGPHAEYYEKTGRGRRITREEAIEVLNKAEEAGLVHNVFATEGLNSSSFICNCCGCSCSGFRVTRQYGGGAISASNFRARIDEEKCVACGACVDICPFNAIRLGDGLCESPEEQIEEYETSYDTMWGRKRWENDYRARTVVTNKGTAPCKTKCPAHISVQGYIRKAAEGKYTEALALIKEDSPFPAVCGRICPHPCEDECTRSTVDESVAIDAIKMFIADQDLDSSVRYIPEIDTKFDPKEKAGKRVAVIGSGPAGLSCAYYLAVDGFQVTVFEKEKMPGGMLTMGIPSFRLGREVIAAEIDVLKELGIEFRTGVEVGRDLTIRQLRGQGFKAFYVAIGAQKGASIGLEGEDLEGVINGVEFLRSVNLDHAYELEGPTVVIGGGNVAIDVARTAIRAGASSVNLYCLESAEDMPALEEEQGEASEEGVTLNNGWGPKRIIAGDGKVAGVEFKRCISVFDNGRFAPKYDEDETITVEASNVILAIGQVIDWGDVPKGEKLEFDAQGRIMVVEVSYQTTAPDIFAGGDVVTGPKFAIDAIALGKQGAQSIRRYLLGRNLYNCREREFKALDKTNLDTSGWDRMPRQKTGVVDPTSARRTFTDLRRGLTEEQVRIEAERCMNCGLSVVDENKCIGCGVCAKQCDFDAIHLERVGETDLAETWVEFYARAAKYAATRAGRIVAKGVKALVEK